MYRFLRVGRKIHHAIFHASREGRAAEITGWANALASFGLGAGVWYLTRSWAGAGAVSIVAFILLRAALTNRLTVWLAASIGTLAVAAAGGGLAWLFAHAIEAWPAAPPIGAALGAVISAILPAWAYGRIAQRRAENMPDSLLEPVSVPSSH